MNSSNDKIALVVTSIAAPNTVLKMQADGAKAHGAPFLLIGDLTSPPQFWLDGCDFYDLKRQLQTGFSISELCPKRHYARKNIGYLLAIQGGATVILETDDDNLPRPGFWNVRSRRPIALAITSAGWLNVYRYFTDELIWPRGFPLDAIHKGVPALASSSEAEVDCPIQQGLADGSPDVDAIYRLVKPQSLSFALDRSIALGPGTWCPFNSQNTAWWCDAFPLLYLPATCTFRMTDIWRSFVAQRICWENGWFVLFHGATVYQERNDHDLLRDFEDEIPGYLNNHRIADALAKVSLLPGRGHIPDNLRLCYEALIRLSVMGAGELTLLEAWLQDLKTISPAFGGGTYGPLCESSTR